MSEKKYDLECMWTKKFQIFITYYANPIFNKFDSIFIVK